MHTHIYAIFICSQIRLELERLDSSTLDGNAVVTSLLARRKTQPSYAVLPDHMSGNDTASTGTGVTGADNNTNDLTGYFQVGKGKNTIAVNPNNGTMAGVCYVIAKDTRKFTIHVPLMTKGEYYLFDDIYHF